MPKYNVAAVTLIRHIVDGGPIWHPNAFLKVIDVEDYMAAKGEAVSAILESSGKPEGEDFKLHSLKITPVPPLSPGIETYSVAVLLFQPAENGTMNYGLSDGFVEASNEEHAKEIAVNGYRAANPEHHDEGIRVYSVEAVAVPKAFH